jgi:hypothetical protein
VPLEESDSSVDASAELGFFSSGAGVSRWRFIVALFFVVLYLVIPQRFRAWTYCRLLWLHVS